MAFDEEEYLQLSGLQHLAFCRRQWALIHIENQWAENERTVENSVFECLLDAAQCKQLQHKLLEIMDERQDRLRFDYLGNRYQTSIGHFGAKPGYDPGGVLLL